MFERNIAENFDFERIAGADDRGAFPRAADVERDAHMYYAEEENDRVNGIRGLRREMRKRQRIARLREQRMY